MFKVGDKVEVVHTGCVYDRYDKWEGHSHILKMFPNVVWQKNEPSRTKKYVIIFIAPHGAIDIYGDIFAILDEDVGEYYLMSIKGITLVETKETKEMKNPEYVTLQNIFRQTQSRIDKRGNKLHKMQFCNDWNELLKAFKVLDASAIDYDYNAKADILRRKKLYWEKYKKLVDEQIADKKLMAFLVKQMVNMPKCI